MDKGNVPGPRWARAVADASDPTWLPEPVAVVVGRHQHVGGQGQDEAAYAVCPRCRTRTVVIDHPQRWEADEAIWRPFREGIAAWEETGEGTAPCSACGARVPVTAWQWEDGFALGALAFEFWGWPPLAPDFLDRFGRQLGHRIAHHMGKF
ncbi:hypothetical protein [Streptomyces sp. NPDC049915]|uniref:hypothetical protein n=1 Tax=Streptomyces sp. NPDC049915 TaxID=3155510 RepID=UPI0034192CD9